jgi:predicted RNA-binding Zn-ribbon protein involved in translation (DUF1610 family)
MPVIDSAPDSALERANQMYWSGDQTVDEIVRELNISRNALYAAVRPVSAERSCPECGDAMVHTNRSNREAHTATCPSCATVSRSTESEAAGASHSPRAHREADAERTGRPSSWSRWRGQLSAVSPQRVAMVGGAAALGVVLGATAARMIREMI